MLAANTQAAIAHALNRLEAELPPSRTYHSIAHTRDDVIPAVTRLGRLAGLDECQVELLRVAAAYHDIGFVERPDDHEVCGARIVAQVLPGFGFTERQVEDVMALILATRLPHSPRNTLEAIMADADMDGLGREDFLERNAELLAEMRSYGAPVNMATWYQDQITFLREHRYFTDAAKGLRGSTKEKNILRLERLVSEENGKSAAAG